MADSQFLIKNGDKFNRPTKDLEFKTTESITASQINDHMSNNGSKFDKEMGYVPYGSIGILTTPDTMFVAKFDETEGGIDPITGYTEGVWRCLAKIPWITA